MKHLMLTAAVCALLYSAAHPSSRAEAETPWKKHGLSFQLAPYHRSVMDHGIDLNRGIRLPNPTGRFAFEADEDEQVETLKVDTDGDGNPETKVKEGRPVFFRMKYCDGKVGPYPVRFFHRYISFNHMNHEFTLTVRSREKTVVCTGRLTTADPDGDVGRSCRPFDGALGKGTAPFKVIVVEDLFSRLIGVARGEMSLE